MTKLTVEDLVHVAEEMGCQIQQQKAFLKLTAPENNRKAAYIGQAKRTVTRVDFSGFEPADSKAIRKLSKEDAKNLNLGAVRGQILTKELGEDVSDQDILDAFRSNLQRVLSDEEGFKAAPKAVQETEEEEEEQIAELSASEA